MENKKVSKPAAGHSTGSNKQEELKENLEQGKNDPSVKDALKKEKQPSNLDDLSPIHNTREIGTSGGDQRASETETNKETDPSKKSSDTTG